MTAMAEQLRTNPQALAYINRLSDYLFPESADGELATDALLATIPLAPVGGDSETYCSD